MADDHCYTTKSAAAYLSTSASTLAKRRIYKNSPRFFRIGRAVRYRKSDLDAFMDANSALSTSYLKKEV